LPLYTKKPRDERWFFFKIGLSNVGMAMVASGRMMRPYSITKNEKRPESSLGFFFTIRSSATP